VAGGERRFLNGSIIKQLTYTLCLRHMAFSRLNAGAVYLHLYDVSARKYPLPAILAASSALPTKGGVRCNRR